MTNLVGIIIPVFNSVAFTVRMLKSIQEQKTSAKIVICVVDNASTDGTPEALNLWQKEDPTTRHIVRNDLNLGFGPACNQGLQHLHLIYGMEMHALICNNDMELLPGCIDELLLGASADPTHGIIGGRLLFPDGTIQHDGAFLGVYGWGLHKHAGIADTFIPETSEYPEQEYVTGALFFVTDACLAALREFYKGVTNADILFDERYAPAYFEEVDACYKARLCKFKTVQATKARAIHYENVTGKTVYKDAAAVKKNLSDVNQVKFYEAFDGVHDGDAVVPEEAEHKILLDCKIYGVWSFTHVMKNLARGLEAAGVDVAIAPEEYHSTFHMDDWDIKRMIQKPKDYWNRVVLRSCEGDHMYLMPPGKKRVAHTTGESNRIPASWSDQLNHVDQVLTTSTFFQQVMEENGVRTPIAVLPNSVNLSNWQREVPKMHVEGLRDCNFVAVFHWGDRKAPDVLFKAFSQEFGPDEGVSLTVHALSMQYALKQQNITLQEYISSTCGTKPRPPILIVQEYLADEVMPRFMKNFDVNILPSRAEGFGLSIIESAALGIPSIVTGYSGVLDFVNEETGWLIDYNLVDIPLQVLPYYRNYIGGQWADPSVDHLRALLRQAYQNKEERLRKGAAAKEKVQAYDVPVIGQKAKSLIFGT